jgi:nucleoside-diphosphate-sugar epimerase
LVGSAVVRRLKHFGFKKILTVDKKKLDLRNQQQVSNFFKKNKIDAVINAAGKVGGIYANNKYKADFIYDNLAMQNNIIHACFQNKVKSLIFLGSSCIYPRNSKQPIKENYLLTGELEKPPLRELPLSTVILPNDSDYNKGGIIRYFARKNVNNSYIEISKTTFDNFSKESAKTKNLK